MLSKLLISNLVLVAIPLLLTSYFLVNTVRTRVENIILERSQAIAVRSTGQIELTLQNVFEKIRLVANLPSLYGSNLMDKEIIINSLVQEFEIYKEITILNKHLGVVRSSAYIAENGRDGIIKKNEVYRGLMAGESHFSGVQLAGEEKLPLINVFEPIANSDEEIVGILWAKVDLKAIWDLVDNSKIGGEQAEAFIIYSNGQYIAHTERSKVLGENFFPESAIVEKINQGISNSEIYTNSAGVQMAAAYAPIAPTGWGLVIQQPVREAFAVVDKMQSQIKMLLWFSAAAAALIALLYSQNILRPVARLVEGINRISTGDLRYRIEPLGRDEISDLAGHINKMSAKLREFQIKLKRGERLETLSKLASVLSHEIRNPLNSMVINMQILRREFNKSKIDVNKMEHYNKVVVNEIKRVDELVSNFLLIARPAKLEFERVQIGPILDEVIAAQLPGLLTKGIRIERNYLDNPALMVDTNKIKQVTLNIIINAVQAMPGGGRIFVKVKGEKNMGASGAQDMAVISFKDTGKGIKANELNQIFDFYFSTKPDGTGLGLAVAQQIIEEHGGYIKVRSKPGQGTSFILYLPLAEKNIV